MANNGKKQQVPSASKSLTTLTAEDILNGSKANLVQFEIPELNGQVYLRSLPAGDVLAYTRVKDSDADSHSALLTLISKAVTDEFGSPLFSESQVSRLGEMSISVFNRLARKVMEMANLGNVDDVEGKGSGETASSVSPTA